jgi:RNA polymerase sigma-70 factor (ECF subfamily)
LPTPVPSFEDVNDAAFLARLRAGGDTARAAFTSLVRATHGRMLAFVRRHLGSADDAQEVVQEVFLAVHKGLPGFEGHSKLTTWMFSLAHYKVCDAIAERTRNRAVFQDAPSDFGDGSGGIARGEAAFAAPEESRSRATAWDSAPDRVHARRSAERLMAEAVALLKPPGCDVYRLRDVEGLSGEDVAGILGLSHAAVRVQLHRARTEIVAWVRARLDGAKGSGRDAGETGKSLKGRARA